MPAYQVTSNPTAPSLVEFSDGKKMHRYDVEIEGEGEVSFWRPTDTPLEGVTAGQTLNLEIKKTKAGKSAKFEKTSGSGPGGDLGREDPPMKTARMGRSAAHKVAVPVVLALMTHDLYTPKNEADLWHKITHWTDKFDQDVRDAAPTPQSPSNGQSQADVPADTTGLNDPQKKTADDSVPW